LITGTILTEGAKRMSMLAWKNLFHDRVRLAVTLVGIVFSLVLIVVQFGLFLGFLDTSSNIVAYSGADLWTAAPGIPHVNGGTPLNESLRWKALQVPGVRKVTKFALTFVNWKLPAGSTESVQIAGYELGSGMGGPWNVVRGTESDLAAEDSVFIDELYAAKLGIRALGDSAEVTGRRARVSGFTHGIRSFTTAPYIFTSFKNAQNYARLAEDQTVYFLIRLDPGVNPEVVRSQLRQRLLNADIYTNEEMRRKTMFYWVFQTGAGVTTLMGAILSLIVGAVVVAQTIYSATIDHIREFGTLKAMGAANWVIYQVILLQAAISAVMGYSVAIVVGEFVSHSSQTGNAPINLPPWMAAATFCLALTMCMGASVLSIRKATQIDPAMVFRG